MPRSGQSTRQWKILQMLLSSKYGKTAAELEAEIDCKQRTLYRDLEALQEAGFPVTNYNMDGKKTWALLENAKQIPIPFSLTELMALYFSHDMLKNLHDTVFYDSLESLFQKIKTTLPKHSLEFLDSVQHALQVSPKHSKDYGKFRQTIDILNEAAISHISVEMVYFTMHSRKQNRRKVDPYTIWYFNGTFYLFGYCHMREEVRVFVLDRIRSLRLTEDVFTVPEDFSLADQLKSSFGVFKGTPEKIKIHFDSVVAGYIEEKVWHESQETLVQKDGSIIFEAEIAVTEDFKSWILSWGSKATVIEPRSLKEEMLAEAKITIEN